VFCFCYYVLSHLYIRFSHISLQSTKSCFLVLSNLRFRASLPFVFDIFEVSSSDDYSRDSLISEDLDELRTRCNIGMFSDQVVRELLE
jgi:hypothetical protein